MDLPRIRCLQGSQLSQRTKANKQMIESLVPRIKVLVDLLCEAVSEAEDDVKERERRKRLEL